jgi:hypothetical protein
MRLRAPEIRAHHHHRKREADSSGMRIIMIFQPLGPSQGFKPASPGGTRAG